MTEPVIYDRKPCIVTLEKGEYWWCACGRSQSQPFCDGSHAGTGLEPVKITLECKTGVALCACKHTKHPPRCDGSHSSLA